MKDLVIFETAVYNGYRMLSKVNLGPDGEELPPKEPGAKEEESSHEESSGDEKKKKDNKDKKEKKEKKDKK